jgi:hypothetical protein
MRPTHEPRPWRAGTPSPSRWLHPDFRWTSHTGEHFDHEAYVASNAGGSNRWSTQELRDVVVLVDGDTAVLRCEVHDVATGDGVPRTSGCR